MARLLFLLLLACSACAKPHADAAAPQSWCSIRNFQGSRFTVCDNKGGEIRLFAAARDRAPLRSFDEVARSAGADGVAFAMNAGMFGEDGRPIGLAVADGKQVHALNQRRGGGNFHLMPNGVFLIHGDGSPAVMTSDAYAKATPRPRLATQSGPMLVIEGKLHPKFDSDGSSRLIRNGVGVTRDGHPLFVIANDPVSFGKMARFFRDALHTPNALYLDGAVSSLWDPPNGRQDSFVELGPIIVAFKPAASAPGRAGRAKS